MKLLLPVIIAIILIGGYFLANPLKQKTSVTQTTITTPSSSSRELKTLQSKAMKISVDLPNEFSGEEKLGSLTIKSNNETISISQNGTNLNNLEDYIKNSRNNLEARLSNKTNLSVNGLETTSGFLGEEKVYFIYTDYNVYLISTKAISLYDDLDQIAQSFRYTP